MDVNPTKIIQNSFTTSIRSHKKLSLKIEIITKKKIKITLNTIILNDLSRIIRKGWVLEIKTKALDLIWK